MGRRCVYATHAERLAAKKERDRLRYKRKATLKIEKTQHARWKDMKKCYKLGSDDAMATLLLDW